MASIPNADKYKLEEKPQPSKIDNRGTVEKVLDENLTAKESAGLAIPAIIGAKTAIPYLSRGAALLGMPKAAAFAGGYAGGNILDDYFGISDKIGETVGPMLAQIQNGVGSNRTGAFTPEELAAERARQSAATGNTQAPILGSTAPTGSTATTATTATTGTPGASGAPVEYDTLGASQDLNKSEEMQTLREENARREAQGLPDLSAPESVQFLNAVNPETFNPLNAEIDKQDQQVVNNFIAQQQAQQAQQAAQPAPAIQQGAPGSPQANFLAEKAKGDLTDKQIADAEAFAKSIGRTFDPATGYSRNPTAPPMTGLRPIDSRTGEPLSQGAIDAISGAGYELPQASVPLPQIPQAPQAQTYNQEETLARLGGRTLNEYLNAPAGTEGVSGLRTDPQGRMIPGSNTAGGPNTRAEAFPGYEGEVKLAKDRLEAQLSDRDRRAARGDDTGSSSLDGLTDNQRSRIYGSGTKEYEMSKTGRNPLTGLTYAQESEDQRRQDAYDDAKIAALERIDPTKLQESKNQALELMKTIDFGGDEKARDSTYRQILMQLLTNIDTFDASTILDPIPKT